MTITVVVKLYYSIVILNLFGVLQFWPYLPFSGSYIIPVSIPTKRQLFCLNLRYSGRVIHTFPIFSSRNAPRPKWRRKPCARLLIEEKIVAKPQIVASCKFGYP